MGALVFRGELPDVVLAAAATVAEPVSVVVPVPLAVSVAVAATLFNVFNSLAICEKISPCNNEDIPPRYDGFAWSQELYAPVKVLTSFK